MRFQLIDVAKDEFPVHRLCKLLGVIRRLAAPRPGALTPTTALTKAVLRALARRWLALDAEIKERDLTLGALTDPERNSPALDWVGAAVCLLP